MATPGIDDRLRENVRKALDEYAAAYATIELTHTDANERRNALISLAQIESAKRVLWMDR